MNAIIMIQSGTLKIGERVLDQLILLKNLDFAGFFINLTTKYLNFK